jgi:ribosomal protein S21
MRIDCKTLPVEKAIRILRRRLDRDGRKERQVELQFYEKPTDFLAIIEDPYKKAAYSIRRPLIRRLVVRHGDSLSDTKSLQKKVACQLRRLPVRRPYIK